MIQLNPLDYAKVAPMVRSVPFNNLFARVVIENKVDGHVFVDDVSNPSVSLIVHKYGMALLCGSYENDAFNHQLVRFLKHPTVEFPAKYLLTHPEQWGQKLAALLGSVKLKVDGKELELEQENNAFCLQTQRINYAFASPSRLHDILVPASFTVARIDQDIYRKIHEVQNSVVPDHFWNSAEDFLENGIGFALLYDDQIVSASFASYIVDDQLELGVETTAAFRKKGYSVYAASALVSYCLTNGYKPLWACRRENIGSSRLAERLGFAPASYHPYFCMT
ncbi:GNAT family N-acetyltransferase [Brevibacillus fluminis]|uniref:GNAT family N-acetyltransferase n=1 Tax=Brevibacillus fluminis TaxID=511487 RepID=A0A3M8CS86_9BACL|nr:GNAT family N-acetyltransferase [Brevibacillus fluminis]RNB78533.1 GNAT family N-acetyltransferase [Brevibacillus fluminis]